MTQSELSEFLSDAPTLFHPEAEKEKMGSDQVIHYSGEKYLTGILTGDDIVAKNDEGLTAVLEDALSNYQEIPFIAVDIEGSSQKINEKYCYVLRLYGSLINGQKTVVILFSIQVFFDICVPDGKFSDECEIKVRDILSGNKVETLKIEHTKAFPFRGYHIEKRHIYKFIQVGLVKERRPYKPFKIIITKLHQMTCTHFIVK